MVHVLRVSGMPGHALIWVRVIGTTRVVYCDDGYLQMRGDVVAGPWKTDTDKGRESGT
jgi:hypothetical protein